MAQNASNMAGLDAETDGLAMLGRGMLGEAGAGGLPEVMGMADPDYDVVTLELGDLISDHNGEVVLFNDSGLRALAIATDAHLVAEGAAERHVTAAGEDVSGFRFMSFDNGLTLYYQDGLDLLVRGEHA
ncbi:MAG TPA: hypothetical protein VFG43_17510 [Geminicoccaceae bacterium]|nr:hypothetical protein [Geminicoccaceae bacterium]